MNGFHRIVTTFAFAAALGATGFGQGPGRGGCGRGDGPRASCSGGQNGAGAQRGKRQGQGRGQAMGQGQGQRAGAGRAGQVPGQGRGAGACGAVSLEGARTDVFGRPLAPRAGASTSGRGACGGGCGTNRADVVPAKPGVGRVRETSDAVAPHPVPDAYAERLQAALAVELQARDTYRAAAAATGVQRYANLARAEERHADAMAAALRRVGHTPRLAPHGEVDSPASPAEADRIGRELEERALQVYAGLIADCPDPELARVLGNIQSANLRHRDAVGR